MLRLSSQSKSTPWERVAEFSATGMCTRPKLMAPFHKAMPQMLEIREEFADSLGAKEDSALNPRKTLDAAQPA